MRLNAHSAILFKKLKIKLYCCAKHLSMLYTSHYSRRFFFFFVARDLTWDLVKSGEISCHTDATFKLLLKMEIVTSDPQNIDGWPHNFFIAKG